RCDMLTVEGTAPEDYRWLSDGLEGGRTETEPVAPDRVRVRIHHPSRTSAARAAADAIPAHDRHDRFVHALRENAMTIGYRDLLRRADQYEGAAVRYRGRVIQVVEDRV